MAVECSLAVISIGVFYALVTPALHFKVNDNYTGKSISCPFAVAKSASLNLTQISDLSYK
jgi:hypothetical protein